MGRYYDGDIEGKFWFAVQPSDAADRFGVGGTRPPYLDYYYTEEDLKHVIYELAEIRESMGSDFDRIVKFFEDHNGYNEKMIMDELGVDIKRAKYLVSQYADYTLGVKIRDCIEEYGECSFTAEL